MTTKTRVIELRVNNTHATLQEIGYLCDLSRERVRQILKKEGLPTAAQVDRILKFCKTCGKKLDIGNKTGYCQRHVRDGITHCPQGHPYNEGNARIEHRGVRVCRVCARIRGRHYYAAHLERLRTYSRRYDAEHPEQARETNRRFRENHMKKCRDCGGPCTRAAKRCLACWNKYLLE